MGTVQISYDKATDSLYIHLVDRPSVDSNELNDSDALVFDANGARVGIGVEQTRQRMANF